MSSRGAWSVFLYLFQFVAGDLEEGIMEGVIINNLINVIHLLKIVKSSRLHGEII